MPKAQEITQTPTEIQWAMLAAYVDGEGCIRISRNNGGAVGNRSPQMQLMVNVSNTDPRLPRWCSQIFGGKFGLYNSAAPSRRAKEKRLVCGKTKPCYRWVVSSRRALWVIENIWPYLIIKREQADIALAFSETLKGKRKWGGGKKLPLDVMTERERYWRELQSAKKYLVPVDALVPEIVN